MSTKHNRNILPLPFIEKLKYDKQRSLSFTNENMKQKWENFLDNREKYMDEIKKKQELYKDENLRWKMYVQYVRDDIPSTIVRSIRAGRSLDEKGRVPIPYDLYNYRKYPIAQLPTKLSVKNHSQAKIPKPKPK